MDDALERDAPERDAAGLDATADEILDRFDASQRLDRAHEQLRIALGEKLRGRGYEEAQIRLLAVNLFGSLSGWMEFILDERNKGRDAVPDFARHMRRAFLSHCREHAIEPSDAIRMVVELANTFMDLAVGFRNRLHLGDTETAADAPME
jgi:hypothetical protein